MQYRKEIDGLRALAVLPVVLFHAGFSSFSGGFVGVDVFFVISGYLITSILIGENEQGRFSIVNFYERRARRILPALFFVMLCCIPFAWLWMLPDNLVEFGNSLIAVTFFVSNFLFWKESGYFAAAAEEKPLLHTWSLAVEEQYYLLFPLLILLVWPLGRRWLGGILLLGIVGLVRFLLPSPVAPPVVFGTNCSRKLPCSETALPPTWLPWTTFWSEESQPRKSTTAKLPPDAASAREESDLTRSPRMSMMTLLEIWPGAGVRRHGMSEENDRFAKEHGGQPLQRIRVWPHQVCLGRIVS